MSDPMRAICIKCGSERFAAGEIVPSLEGGFDVIMPCAVCQAPNAMLHGEDAELARLLVDFFAAGPPLEE